ncbi:MAG TPA: hypothetical protein DCY31_06055 [Ruminococcaceae bacterium]|nr:hypothetical protein [Oscillospiraceae bacterium]HAY73397.1 hypothetical protein [Oscillospiraceae bacterium]
MASQRSGDKTKLMLAESLRNLMRKKPLDKIKIHEIVDACGVNRQTFYYHFQDIYALVEWMYQHDAVELIEKNNKDILNGEIGTRDDWDGIINALFKYIEEHRNEILSVINSRARVYFSNFVYEGLKASVRRVVDVKSENIQVDEYYKNFISNFYAIALGGIVQSWLETSGAARMSSQELIHLLGLTVTGNIEAALARAANEKK